MRGRSDGCIYVYNVDVFKHRLALLRVLSLACCIGGCIDVRVRRGFTDF